MATSKITINKINSCECVIYCCGECVIHTMSTIDIEKVDARNACKI